MARSSSRRPRSQKRATRSGLSSSVNVKLAMLEQQQEYSSAQFTALGEKFDRILERLEQLTLNSTTLISRHDTQIQTMQKQLNNAENTVRETRDKLDDMNTNLAHQLKVQIDEAMSDMSKALEDLSENMMEQHKTFDRRITNLERWRWMLIGAGLAVGAVITKTIDFLDIIK